MSLNEWTGAAVEPSTGDHPPSSEEYHPVEVPGRPERFAGADAVAYRTEFGDPRDGDERATLELRGLFARARIWLNGELLGEHDAYFVPARYELDLEPDNVLVVECRAPERFGGVYATDLVPDERAVPGIWWGAEMETHPQTFVDSLSLSPRRTDDGPVVDARMAVEAGEPIDDRISLSVRPQGFRGGGVMERARVDAEAGERVVVEKTLRLRDPAYWWPTGHGPQHQYAVRARLGDAEHVVKTGICDVAYDGDDGLFVNGQRVAARGFSLLPTGEPTWDVERAANADANLVRARGHVAPDEFYEACADAGLLVWQDLPLSGPGAYDVERATDLAETLSTHLERHPSVAAFGVHDEPSDHLAGVGPGRTSRYKVRWRAWRAGYDDAPDREVADALPEDVPVFPVTSAPGIGADASTLHAGWEYGDAADAEWLLEKYDCGGVVGSFGAGALADAGDTDDDIAGFDAAAHDAYVSGDVEESQSYQARNLKALAETLRRRGSDVLAAAALRDADDGAGMGVLAADGTEKAGYAAVAASFAPVQAVLDAYPDHGATRELTVCNDTPEAISGTVTWEAGDRSGTADAAVEPYDRASAGTMKVPADADAVTLSFAHADGTARNEYLL